MNAGDLRQGVRVVNQKNFRLDGAELSDFARMIARVFAGRGYNGDLDDVAQDAAVVALVTARRKRFALKGNRGYYYQAAVCEAGVTIGRQISALSVSEHVAQKRGREFANRTQLVGCGGRAEEGAVEVLDGDTMPDARRRREDAAAARARLWDLLEEYLRAMPAPDRQALSMMLGIGTPQRDPDEAAEVLGRPVPAVWASVRRLGKLVRGDRGAARARRIYLEHQEAA